MRSISFLILAIGLMGMAYGQSTSCPSYTNYSVEYHPPFSGGVYNLSYMRPDPSCRTFVSQAVEDTITRLNSTIKDPDLSRLFENAFPNTLDTAVKWKGFANGSDEELTFLITGDINAMWIRDSANQLQSYLSLLTANTSTDSIASLYRGVINLQARYIVEAPYCQSFQPPVESNLPPEVNSAGVDDVVYPSYSNQTVFECKYELDSLAAFLEISTNYYTATNDSAFFGKYQWTSAVQAIMNVAESMMIGTYASNGSVNAEPYNFVRTTTTASDCVENNGMGNPVQGGTGLIRSFFRPSDDSTIYQLFIPANMMFSRYLNSTAAIMSQLGQQPTLASQMTSLSASVAAAITEYGIVSTPQYGQVYAYEIDGYGSQNLMDDANIPSLLSAPMYGYLSMNDTVYQNTRNKILSSTNPYYMQGPVLNAVGGPHDGPGFAWPMAAIADILTTDNTTHISDMVKQLVSSTDGLGLIHESINTFNQSDWTRQWFSWANGLFGQMILELEANHPEILAQSFQSCTD